MTRPRTMLQVLLSVPCMLLILSGCHSEPIDEPVSSPFPEDAAVIEHLTVSEPQTHVPLQSMGDENDELVENPYYRRGTNAEGDPVYEVLRADNGQWTLLPLSCTILYTSQDGNSYYETEEVSFTYGGETTTVLQYQLFVPETGDTNP